MNSSEIKTQMSHLGRDVDKSFIDFIEQFDDSALCNRKNFVGHITASGTIVDFQSKEVLLLHHKFLDAWHVPGGHVDPDDESTLAAALREIEEECGIKPFQLTPINVVDGVQYCVEINSHHIPHNNNKDEQAHLHHDFRYLFEYCGDKNIRIDSNESISYKWVSIENEYLGELFDVEHLKELLYHEDCWSLSEDEMVEMCCAASTSIAIIEGMARFDIVKTKDKTGVRERADRGVFNKNEGKYIYFYSETDRFKPNDIDWNTEMTITIWGEESVQHICTPRVNNSYIAIEEFVDISLLPCGHYNFDLDNGYGELYSFGFRLVDAPTSHREFATFDGVQLRGLYKDGSVRSGGVSEEQVLHIDYNGLERLQLTFSFSNIHDIEMFQCMIAIYCNAEYIGLISETEESATYVASENDTATLTFDKALDDYSIVRNYKSRLELRIFDENVECIDFEIV